LHKGEVLGLPLQANTLSPGEIDVGWQFQRVRRTLIRKKRAKAGDDQSGDVLPLPDICTTALESRHAQRSGDQTAAGDQWACLTRRQAGLTATAISATPFPVCLNRAIATPFWVPGSMATSANRRT
jgi:hypothetical protein